MDISLYYQEKGTGFPLILLHGNGEDHHYFVHQIEHFSRTYRVLALDTRGHGQSPRGTAPFTLSQFAEDLNTWMIAKNISEAILLGFSDGANIALQFALKYPQKTKALILNGGNLDPSGVKRITQIPIEIGYTLAAKSAKKSEAAQRHAELLSLMVKEPHIPAKKLHDLAIPAFVIAGTKDMIKRTHTEEIARNIPGASLCFIPGNHFIANKKPVLFNQAVDMFLQSLPIG